MVSACSSMVVGRVVSGAASPLTCGAFFDRPGASCDVGVCATGDDHDFATSRGNDFGCGVDEEPRRRRRVGGGGCGYVRRPGSDRPDPDTGRLCIDFCCGSDCDWPTFGVVLAGIFGIFLPAATTNRPPILSLHHLTTDSQPWIFLDMPKIILKSLVWLLRPGGVVDQIMKKY